MANTYKIKNPKLKLDGLVLKGTWDKLPSKFLNGEGKSKNAKAKSKVQNVCCDWFVNYAGKKDDNPKARPLDSDSTGNSERIGQNSGANKSTRKDFHPWGKKVLGASYKVYPSGGTLSSHFKKAEASIKFAKPNPPLVSVKSASGGTVTFHVDCKHATSGSMEGRGSSGYPERAACRWKLFKHTDGGARWYLVKSGTGVTDTSFDVSTTSADYKDNNVRYKLEAWGQGLAGDSDSPAAAYTALGYPNKPYIDRKWGKDKSGKKVETTWDTSSANADGQVLTLDYHALADDYHKVDKVELEYLLAPVKGTSGWSKQDGCENRRGAGCITLQMQNAVMPGEEQHLYLRLKSTRTDCYTYSDVYGPVRTGAPRVPVIGSVSTEAAGTGKFLAAVTWSNATEMAGGSTEYRVTYGDKTVVGWTGLTASPQQITKELDTGKRYELQLRNTVVGHTTQRTYSLEYDLSASEEAVAASARLSVPALDEGCTSSPDGGSAMVTWSFADDEGDGTEVAWSDDPNAWQNTSGYKSHDVEGDGKALWLDELEAGTTYYVRCRRYAEGDERHSSKWSGEIRVTPYETPGKPVLTAPPTVPRGESLQLTWAFSAVHPQTSATVFAGSRQVAHATTAKRAAVAASDLGGDTAALTVKVSCGGATSEASDPVTVRVVDRPTAEVAPGATFRRIEETGYAPTADETFAEGVTYYTVSGTGAEGDPLVYEAAEVTVGDAVPEGVYHVAETVATTVLESQPAQLALTCSSDAVSATVTVAALGDNRAVRPDMSDATQRDGQTVLSWSPELAFSEVAAGSGTAYAAALSLPVADLLDGGAYRVTVACEEDGVAGDPATLDFLVRWAHQAPACAAEATYDAATGRVTLSLPAPDGAAGTDVCDVYRISPDGVHQLIWSGGAFGTGVVDRWPPLGTDEGQGSYRVVTRTADGDTDWDDVGCRVPARGVVVDFGGSQLSAPWNNSYDDAWDKGFEVRRRIGGAQAGHWKAGVGHTGKVSASMVRGAEEADVRLAMALARYEGVCFVRAPHGVCFAANVDVSLRRAADSGKVEVQLETAEVDFCDEFRGISPDDLAALDAAGQDAGQEGEQEEVEGQ